MNYKQHNKQLIRELKHLKKELHSANLFKDLHLQKWETWEERARSLYRELHGKDAPVQG